MAVDGERKRRMLSYRWLVFGAIGLAYFFVYFHRTTGGAISTDLQDYYGVGAASVALLASAYLYAYTLMQIPSGIITDRFGPRRAVSVFVLLIAAGSLISAYSAEVRDFDLMIVGKFVIGIGAAVVTIPGLKILSTWFRINEFATMNGVLLLIGNVGGIAAATPMIVMIDSVGLEGTYLVLAAVTAAIAGMCWMAVRDRPSDMGYPSIEEIVSEETGAPMPEPEKEKVGTVEALKTVFSDTRGFWPVAIWFFVMYGTVMVWQASQAGAFYQNVYGYSVTDAGMMVTTVAIGMLFGAPLAGRLSDRIFRSRRKVLVFGSLSYTAVWFVIWLTCGMDQASGIWVQTAINFLLGFFNAFFVVSYAQVKELFPVSMAGTSTAALNLFPFAGGAILVTISGFLVTGHSLGEYRMLWGIMSALMVVGCICAILSKENRKVRIR